MTSLEALRWIFSIAGDDLSPYPNACYVSGELHYHPWYCYGCNGVFKSEKDYGWPEPTDDEFPHEPGCKYIAVKKLLGEV